MCNKIDLTVIVVTHNRWPSLNRTLRHLTNLPEHPDIIVVDNHSSDKTPRQCPSVFPAVKYIRLHKNTGTEARNIGAEASRTSLISFCDDDSWWEPGALTTASRLFLEYPLLGLVTGKILVGPDGKLDETCRKMSRSPIKNQGPLPGQPVLGFLCCAVVIRRNVFLDCGGFEKRFHIGGEETLLALNIRQRGYAVIYCDQMTARHFPSTSPRPDRQAVMVRNNLWTCWLKCRMPFIFLTLGSVLRHYHHPAVRRGMMRAFSGLPWVVARRNPVSRQIEEELRQIGWLSTLY